MMVTVDRSYRCSADFTIKSTRHRFDDFSVSTSHTARLTATLPNVPGR